MQQKSFSELWDEYEYAINRINKYIKNNNVYMTPKKHDKTNENEINLNKVLDIPFEDKPLRTLTKNNKPETL